MEPRLSRRGFTSSRRNRAWRETHVTIPQHIDPEHAVSIRQILLDVEAALETMDLDPCDTSEVQDIVDMTRAELDRPLPNVSTLGTYMNSIARSLRSQPNFRTVVMELDAAMREAHVPTTWEH